MNSYHPSFSILFISPIHYYFMFLILPALLHSASTLRHLTISFPISIICIHNQSSQISILSISIFSISCPLSFTYPFRHIIFAPSSISPLQLSHHMISEHPSFYYFNKLFLKNIIKSFVQITSLRLACNYYSCSILIPFFFFRSFSLLIISNYYR